MVAARTLPNPQMVPLSTFQRCQQELQKANQRIREVEQENTRLRKIVYNTKFSMNERAIAIEIADQVKDAKHVDEQGRKLFSIKDASTKLGLSRGTISNAVDILAESGYVKDKDTKDLRDKDGKLVKSKVGKPISTIHLDIEQEAYEDFSKVERSAPRKIKDNRKPYTWQCQSCLTEDITIETDRYLVCKNPNCHKHGQRVLIDTTYEDQIMDAQNLCTIEAEEIQAENTESLSVQNLCTIELLDNSVQNLCTIQSEDESNKTHSDASAATDSDSILKEWLEKRCGTNHIITATGRIDDPQGKYIYKPQGYQPDLDKYIAGDENHIYGSRLLNPETGLTNVLCFEIDNAEQDEQIENYLWRLARAGAAAVYWQRHAQGRQRGHLELYFDQAVNAEVARAWAIEVCPCLEDVPECYPCKEPMDKRNQALSWPLYQRIGDTVYPCKAKYMLPEPHDGTLQECDPADKESLAQLVTLAVTPAALVEEFAVVVAEREALQKREQEKENAPVCCFIGQKPKPITQFKDDRDLAPQVIAEQCSRYSWDDIAALCGGWQNGFFKAVWRGERTASVRPDKDGVYACDYGNHGSFPKKLDTYGAYCLIQGIEQKAVIAEQCAELRRQQSQVVKVVEIVDAAPATELFPQQKQLPQRVYIPCIVCGKPKSVKRADGVLTCGTDHTGGQ